MFSMILGAGRDLLVTSHPAKKTLGINKFSVIWKCWVGPPSPPTDPKNSGNHYVFDDFQSGVVVPVTSHFPKKLWKSPCLDDFGWSRTSGCLDACFSASKRRASLRPANIFHNLEIKENEWLWKPRRFESICTVLDESGQSPQQHNDRKLSGFLWFACFIKGALVAAK